MAYTHRDHWLFDQFDSEVLQHDPQSEDLEEITISQMFAEWLAETDERANEGALYQAELDASAD